MTAMDAEQLRRAQREIEHPEHPEHDEPEPRGLWVLDVMAGCGIALILFYVAMRAAEGLV